MKPTLLDILPQAKKNVSLASCTTFKIGGRAKYFFVARSTKTLVNAVHAARTLGMPFFILAGGSNLLVSDQGFPGLAICVKTKGYHISGTKLFAEAGVSMNALVKETGKLGLSGFEWAGGLPGSLGGAIRGNAGAFGGEIKDNIVKVSVLDGKGKIREFNRRQCAFSYRDSIFKKKGWIVLSAVFSFKKGGKESIQRTAKEHILYRKERHPLEYPNAGSIFKNCDLRLFTKKLQKELSHVVKVDPSPVVPTAYLTSQANLKGMRVGNAEVSRKHPNYMVNLGNARARDVKILIQKVQCIIKKKFSVDLEVEIEYIS
jgi:UDP-N-acetylmuramate dehydrogenase